MKKLLLFLVSLVSIVTVTSCGHTHEYKEVITKDATCSSTGLKKIVCECGNEKDEEIIPRKAHTEVKLDPIISCTENGLSEGKKCSICNAIILKQQPTSAIGHAWDDGAITKESTLYEEGVKTYTCTRCHEIRTESIEKEGYYFGSYPQTKVEANSSNGLSSISFNDSTWSNYLYYFNGIQRGYMKYLDVDVDNNGTYDYRGVYFTSPRSSDTGINCQNKRYQVANGYNTNTIYWFKYEPIKWEVLESKDGKALIISKLIIDSQQYQHYDYSIEGKFNHNGGYDYPNIYEFSDIRKWLNDKFYKTAFNDLEKAIIETTNVDNSASSTTLSSNKYACNNTNDKMFLLSYQELEKYFAEKTTRQTKTTDYAQAQGAYVSNDSSYLGNGYWWLRSPSSLDGKQAHSVSSVGVTGNYWVDLTYYGVRAACWINL